MILFLLNVFFFSSAFGNTEDIIRANIKKTDLYRPGRILADPISKFGFIAELIPDLYEGADSKLDLSVTELRKHYLYLGHLFFLAKEGIADIFFYPSLKKDSSSLEYLRQVAQGGYPITTFLDGGGILAFHDLIHILQLMLPRSLLKGYSDFAKDFLVFLKFIYYP